MLNRLRKWLSRAQSDRTSVAATAQSSVAAGRDIVNSPITIGLDSQAIIEPVRELAEVFRPVPVTHRVKIQRFIEYYLGVPGQPVPFGGREAELRVLCDWINEPSAAPNLLITGPAGRGKTALVIRWMQLIPKDWKIAFVPISIRFQTNHATIFYEALAHQLAALLNVSAGGTQRDASEFFRDRCLEMLEELKSKSAQTLIILDGLDEASGWEIDTSLLQTNGRGQIRTVVLARTLAGDHDSPEGWLRRLEWSPNPQSCRTIIVPPLSQDDIGRALYSMGFPVSGLTTRADVLGELQRLTDGDPLLVRMYAERLWERGLEAKRSHRMN